MSSNIEETKKPFELNEFMCSACGHYFWTRGFPGILSCPKCGHPVDLNDVLKVKDIELEHND